MNEFMDQNTLEQLHKHELEIMDEFVKICNKYNLTYFLYGGTLLGAVRHKGFIPWDDDLDLAMPRKDYEKFIEVAKNELNSKFELDNYHTNKLCYLNFSKIRNKNTILVQDFQKDNYEGPKGIWIDIFPLDNAKKEEGKLQSLRIIFIKAMRSIAHYKSNIYLGNNKIKLKKVLGKIFGIIPLNTLLSIQDTLMKKNAKKETEYFISIASQYNYKKQTMKKDIFIPAKELEFEGRKYKVPNNYTYFLERIYGDYMKLPPKEKRITHNPVEIKFEKEYIK